MKHLISLVVFVFLAVPSWSAPQRYALQADESSVGFSWYLGKEEIKGSMPVASADLSIDFAQLSNSNIAVAVDVQSARAGFPFASQGMKSRKVLWANKFPQITFQSTAVRRNDNGALIDGNLTVRGVTKPATFSAELFRQAGTEVGDRSRISVRLTGQLSRQAFGADGWSDLAGDEVKLSILARMRIAE